MKLSRISSSVVAPVVAMATLIVQPVFLVPFIAGASFSYLYPERLPTPLQAFAEDSGHDSDTSDDELVDLGSPRTEKLQRGEAEKKKKRELPSSGVLSQTRSSGTSGTSVPGPWGSDALDKSAPPITGSVSRLGKNEWVMRVFNNSEDTYSASVEIVQMGHASRRLKSDNYSYTLKGKAKVEREFKVNQGVTDCVLNLTRWKNLTAKKKAVAAEQTRVAPATPTKVIEQPAPTVAADGQGGTAQ